jgi:hypothetical protein
MAFEKGKSGNPKGRPKKNVDTAKASVLKAFVELAARKPWLVREAIEKGLKGPRPLGYLELGARLLKEIGATEDTKTQVAIVFTSPLEMNKLREVQALPSPVPQLISRTEPDLSFLEEDAETN